MIRVMYNIKLSKINYSTPFTNLKSVKYYLELYTNKKHFAVSIALLVAKIVALYYKNCTLIKYYRKSLIFLF
ncbi:hypothetical protein CNEO3_290021 [Clostridium neonatale]|nr:hypothetical protein CNEO3_290021 [Clostridium neonatale]